MSPLPRIDERPPAQAPAVGAPTHGKSTNGDLSWTRLVLWFGVLAGIFESVSFFLKQWYRPGPMIVFSPTLWWLTPLVDVLLMAVLAAVTAGLLRWRPRWNGSARIIPMATLTFVLPLLNVGRVHTLAAIVLALGMSVTLARGAQRFPLHFAKAVRFSTPLLLLWFVAAVLWVHIWPRWVERRVSAGLPAAKNGAPNVVWIVLDTVRASSLGLYGGVDNTPWLKSFAAQGVTFERAYSTCTWTLPSHASLMTGCWPQELSSNWLKALDTKHPTVAEVFRDSGYDTAGFVGNVGFAGRSAGIDRGFTHFEDHHLTGSDLPLASRLVRTLIETDAWRSATDFYDWYDRKPARPVSDGLLDWLESRNRSQRSYFAFLNYFDAHDPYLPPNELRAEYGPHSLADKKFTAKITGARPLSETDPRVRMARQAYEGCIRGLDDELARLFGELERRGQLQNTLVIITADHGEHFGEHGLMTHGNSCHQSLTHVPLVVVFPGRVPAGRRIDQPVSLRDVAATILSLTECQGREHIPGASLASCWDDALRTPAISPAVSFVQLGVRVPKHHPNFDSDIVSIVADGWYYVRYPRTDKEELYAQDDTGHLRNLVGTAEAHPVLPKMRLLLAPYEPKSR